MAVRASVIICLVALLVACAGGAWASIRALTVPFIAPGAADVQIRDNGIGERVITYRMPNPDDAWQTNVARRLSLSGWSLAADRYQWGGTETTITLAAYTRTSQFWFLTFSERAELQGNREEAQITVSYAVHVP